MKHIFIKKHIVYKQWDAALILERKDAWEASEEENRVALIKSLITKDRKVALGAQKLSVTRIGQKCELIQLIWSLNQGFRQA